MQLRNLLLILSLCCFACKNKTQQKPGTAEEKFDKTKWATMKNGEHPYRNRMLKDLVYNVKLKGLKHAEIIALLGEPSRTDSNYLFYRVSQERIRDVLTLHTRTLVLKFGKDSTVEWRKIHE